MLPFMNDTEYNMALITNCHTKCEMLFNFHVCIFFKKDYHINIVVKFIETSKTKPY